MDNQQSPAVETTNSLSSSSRLRFDSTTISLLIALTFLLVAVAGLSFYIWYGMQNTPATQVAEEKTVPLVTEDDTFVDPVELTSAERMEILESLSVSTSTATPAERRAILKSL